jgi:hypothetical protein
MKYKLIIVLIILLHFQKLFAYDNSLRPNSMILDLLTDISVVDICSYLNKQNIDTFNLNVKHHPADWLVTQYLISKKNCNNIVFIKNDSLKNNYPELNIQIINLGVYYSLDSNNNDSLNRIFIVNIRSNYVNKNNQIIPLPDIEKKYFDKISHDDIPFIENNSYPFATAPVPEPKRTFFEEVAEPLIVVTSAIVTVVLLFTVRSK